MQRLKPLLLIALVASIAVNAWLAWRVQDDARHPTQLVEPERFEVIRTKGGLLQVSTLKVAETFQSTTDHKFFGRIYLGQTVTKIRVPAVYHYHIELAPEWKVSVRDKTFIVVAPAVKPTLPIAIDTARLESYSTGTWSVLTGPSELDLLQKSITQTLAIKATKPSYIQAQRESARKTVHEFVEKWLVTQGKWRTDETGKAAGAATAIKVFFDDEPIASIRPMLEADDPL